MSKTYYISDTHFRHRNILKYCGRTQFMNKSELNEYKEILSIEDEEKKRIAMRNMPISDDTIKKHDETIIKRWNSRVNDSDTVIVLGDFCWVMKGDPRPHYYLERLNGNIVLINGNHDRNNRNNTKIESMRVREGKWLIWCTHNPRHIRFDIRMNFCGHVHEKWKFGRVDKNAGLGKFDEPILNTTKAKPNGCNITDVINLSVDVWDYYPRNVYEIKKDYHQWRNEYESR